MMLTRGLLYDKIQTAGTITDSDLLKALKKKEILTPPDKFNKILLDLEILGLINVYWLTKDDRRIEATKPESDEDEVDAQNREMSERDYEASFPNKEN